jgi:hypothetical protein
MHQALRMGRCYMTCSEIFLWDLSIIFYRHYNLKMLDDMSDEMIIFTQSSMGLKMGMCSIWTWTFRFSCTHLPTCMNSFHQHIHLGWCIWAYCRYLMKKWASIGLHLSYFYLSKSSHFFMKLFNPLINLHINLRFDIWRSILISFYSKIENGPWFKSPSFIHQAWWFMLMYHDMQVHLSTCHVWWELVHLIS